MDDPLLSSMLADAAALIAPAASPTALFPPAVISRSGGVGVGGLSGTGTTSSKMFSVIRLSCDDDRVCFGKIGTGGSFCIRTRNDCPYKHEVKVPFFGPDQKIVFICQTVGVSAFVAPLVSDEQIPDDVWNSWETKTLSSDEWRREFQAVVSTDDKFATFEDIKKEARFLDTADSFRTPGKRKRDLDADLEDLSRSALEKTKTMRTPPPKYERILPEEKEELDKVVQYGMKKGVLTGVVSGLETNLILMNGGLEELSTLTTTRFKSDEQTMNLLSGAIHNVRASIGSPPELSSLFVAPTMWGTMSFMADEIIRVGIAVQDLGSRLNPFQTSTTSQLLGLKSNGEGLTKVVSMLMSSIKKLTAENQAVQASVAELCRAEGARAAGQKKRAKTTSTDSHGEMVDELMMMMNENTIAPEPKKNARFEENSTGNNTEGIAIDVSEYPILAPGNYKKFCQLVDDVGTLKLSTETTAIKFGNLGIRNLQECSRWVTLHFSEERYGLVVDPLNLLDRLFGDDQVDPLTQLKTMESRMKLNIDTGAESSSITSMGHLRPRIFHDGRPTMTCDQKTSRLNNKLGKPARWKTGGEGGVRNHIIEQMNVLQPHISDDIIYTFGNGHPGDSKAQMIATLSLTTSVTFITQLLNYIDALYEKLHVYSKFTSETAWSLSMQVLDRILADLYVPKEGVVKGMKGDRTSICAHVLWASFRTLDIAQGYVDANFVNHPAVSSEFIKFLATNSGSEKIEQLDATVTTIKASLASAVVDVRNAGTKSDTASTKCGELNGLIIALTKRVKTMEDRGSR